MTKYNGWTNYETWLVNLWMSNDEGSYLYWAEEAKGYDDAHALADALKDHHEEWYLDAVGENLHSSLLSDLLGAAFSSVNWIEIAEHLLYDAA